MSVLVTVLVALQALGAAVGAACAVWSELAYMRAMRDGQFDSAERVHMRHIGRGLRFGMSLLLLSSLGLVLAAYARQTPVQPAVTPNYWMFIVLALLVTAVTWALSRKRLPFKIGSATLFAAWWFLAFLSFGWLPAQTFGAAIASFIIAAAIFYALLQYARLLAKHS